MKTDICGISETNRTGWRGNKARGMSGSNLDQYDYGNSWFYSVRRGKSRGTNEGLNASLCVFLIQAHLCYIV